MERVRIGTKKDTKVAEIRTCGRRAVARKEAKGKGEVARVQPEHVGLVARHATLQRMKITVETLKMQLTMRKICKRGVG